MKPEVARADRSNTQLNNTKAYFLYEDHIGRPVLLSEYADYDTDGDTYGDGSYFMDNNEDEYPYYQVYYNMPFWKLGTVTYLLRLFWGIWGHHT